MTGQVLLKPEVGIYIRKILRKKERKYALYQEKSKIQEKQERNHAFDQGIKKENKILTKK